MRITTTVRTTTRIPFVQVVKTSVAAIIAWFVCIALLPAQLPIFATIAALLVVQPSINQTFGKAVERSLGVITGVRSRSGSASRSARRVGWSCSRSSWRCWWAGSSG